MIQFLIMFFLLTNKIRLAFKIFLSGLLVEVHPIHFVKFSSVLLLIKCNIINLVPNTCCLRKTYKFWTQILKDVDRLECFFFRYNVMIINKIIFFTCEMLLWLHKQSIIISISLALLVQDSIIHSIIKFLLFFANGRDDWKVKVHILRV